MSHTEPLKLSESMLAELLSVVNIELWATGTANATAHYSLVGEQLAEMNVIAIIGEHDGVPPPIHLWVKTGESCNDSKVILNVADSGRIYLRLVQPPTSSDEISHSKFIDLLHLLRRASVGLNDRRTWKHRLAEEIEEAIRTHSVVAAPKKEEHQAPRHERMLDWRLEMFHRFGIPIQHAFLNNGAIHAIVGMGVAEGILHLEPPGHNSRATLHLRRGQFDFTIGFMWPAQGIFELDVFDCMVHGDIMRFEEGSIMNASPAMRQAAAGMAKMLLDGFRAITENQYWGKKSITQLEEILSSLQ